MVLKWFSLLFFSEFNSGFGSCRTLLKSERLIARFHDMTVMGQTVEQRGGQFGITKHIIPFRERQIGGNYHAGALINLREQIEQQCPTRLRERQIAQLIEKALSN